jgi:hypothetical protein
MHKFIPEYYSQFNLEGDFQKPKGYYTKKRLTQRPKEPESAKKRPFSAG